jgi:hypothetical protein
VLIDVPVVDASDDQLRGVLDLPHSVEYAEMVNEVLRLRGLTKRRPPVQMDRTPELMTLLDDMTEFLDSRPPFDADTNQESIDLRMRYRAIFYPETPDDTRTTNETG